MKSLFKNHSFRFFLTLSFGIHIGLALLAFLFTHSLLFQSKKTALMIEGAIQIDQIDLSDLKKISSARSKNTASTPSLPKAPSKKKPKELKKEKTIPLKKEKSKKLDQNKKQLDETKQTDEEVSNETNLNETASDETNTNNSQLSSEQISEISYYANQILRQIRRNWNLPAYLTNKALTTQVEIKINLQGRLIYTQIILSSGDDLYDSFVLKAIEKGSPYFRPSPSVQKIIQNGIVLNVPSQ